MSSQRTESMEHFDPPGTLFYDTASRREMKLVYEDAGHWTAGWLLYRGADGQWVTLRKATDSEVLFIAASRSEVQPIPEQPEIMGIDERADLRRYLMSFDEKNRPMVSWRDALRLMNAVTAAERRAEAHESGREVAR